MKETPAAFMSRIGGTVARFLDIMAYLASPKLIARYPVLSREHLLEHIDSFLAIVGETRSNADGGFTRAEPHALRLREICVGWQEHPTVSGEMTLAARDLLGSLGLGEPPEGWDLFEGLSDVQS